MICDFLRSEKWSRSLLAQQSIKKDIDRGKIFWNGHKDTILLLLFWFEVKFDELYCLSQFHDPFIAAPEQFGHCFPASDPFDIEDALLFKSEGLVEVYEEAQMGLHS